MPSPALLTRTNVSYSRPSWNSLQIDPQAPEAQQLYTCASVPLGFTLGASIPKADNTLKRWPVLYTSTNNTALADPTVGSYLKAVASTAKFTVTMNPPLPATAQGTEAVWIRRRGALVAGNQVCSTAAAAPSNIVVGTDVTLPILLTWGNASVATVSGLILPLDEWALVVGTHANGFSTTYLFSAGIDLSFGPYADSNVTRVVSTFAAGGTGATSVPGDYAELCFWARAFTPNEVRALWEPATRWRRYYVPKTYWQFGDTAVSDTQPLAAQPPRPRYVGLNAFSPQAQGLVEWLPAVDGALVQAWTRNIGQTVAGVSSDVPSVTVPRVTSTTQGQAIVPDPAAPVSQVSDLGRVARSAKEAIAEHRSVQYYQPVINLSRLTSLTCVYWIFPLPSPYTDAWYWGTQPGGVDDTIMQNDLLTFETTQSFPLPQDPHVVGRWQMITVSRTLAGVTIWRDQTSVFTGVSTGTALDPADPAYFQVGGVLTFSGALNGVNALWADFRIYDREWKQPDVDYAYNVKTRWDYYADPSTKPWELPLTPTPPVTAFLSRLSLMGAG